MTRIDEIVDGIYRISTFSPDFGISFDQFLIDDEEPALIHTGTYDHYEAVRTAIAEVLDPGRLAHIVLGFGEPDPVRPPTASNSISGCAHSAELQSPRSQ